MRKEYTRPLEKPIDSDRNVFSILQERVDRDPNGILVEYSVDGHWSSFTSREFRDKVVALAKGLIVKGISAGDSVAIIAHTSWQWTAVDMAIMSIGALTVPIYETNSPAQVRMIINDSRVVMAFAEDESQRAKIEQVAAECPTLGEVFVFDNDAIDTIIEFGRGLDDTVFWNREKAVRGADLATIVYTSGSTGTPKGIELSHSNFVFIVYSGIQSMPDIAMKPDRRLLLFLPLAHVFARYMQFFSFAGNITLGLSCNLSTILSDFHEFKPTFILAVPRIFEKIYNAASQKAGSGITGRIFANSAQVARDWSKAQQSGHPIPLMLRLRRGFYRKIVYTSIMDVFGGSVEYAVSGGAPMDSSIAHFFNGVGLPLLEGYGMTETCAPSSVNPTTGYRIGTIGLPLEGVTMGVDEDSELCIKSRAVCVGYHNHPETTATQIVDGWLHTGDLGSIDDDGFVRITGRKKDLIITAGGKNVSPGQMEASVMTSPVVDQCVVIGDRRPFVAALITLDLNDTNQWLTAHGVPTVKTLEEASANPIIRTEVERAVSKANELVSRAESIRKFEIIPERFTQDNGMLTPSLKAKRQVITDHYRDVIDKVIYVPRKKR